LKIIEVFKTNIQTEKEAADLIAMIHISFMEVKANFDLDDCDRILRVEAFREIIVQVPILFMKMGYQCSPLPD